MISMLMLFFVTCLTTFGSDVKVADVQVGINQIIPITSPVLKTSRYNFFFRSDDYGFRLVNKLITKEVIVAILPPEYALKAVWTSDALDIVGKTSKHYLYLVRKEKGQSITKEIIKNKKILLLENSADEFYLKKYLGGIQFQKINGTTFQLMNSVIKKNTFDFILMDSMNYFFFKKKNPEMSALRIEGGVYYMVTRRRENVIMFNPLTRDVFKKNNIKYYDLTKSDLVELENLNNSMVKKRHSQKSFETLFIELLQR